MQDIQTSVVDSVCTNFPKKKKTLKQVKQDGNEISPWSELPTVLSSNASNQAKNRPQSAIFEYSGSTNSRPTSSRIPTETKARRKVLGKSRKISTKKPMKGPVIFKPVPFVPTARIDDRKSIWKAEQHSRSAKIRKTPQILENLTVKDLTLMFPRTNATRPPDMFFQRLSDSIAHGRRIYILDDVEKEMPKLLTESSYSKLRMGGLLSPKTPDLKPATPIDSAKSEIRNIGSIKMLARRPESTRRLRAFGSPSKREWSQGQTQLKSKRILPGSALSKTPRLTCEKLPSTITANVKRRQAKPVKTEPANAKSSPFPKMRVLVTDIPIKKTHKLNIQEYAWTKRRMTLQMASVSASTEKVVHPYPTNVIRAKGVWE